MPNLFTPADVYTDGMSKASHYGQKLSQAMREKQANTQSFLFETDEYNLPGFQGSVKFGDTHSGRNRSALVKDCFSKKQTYDKGCESSLHTSLNDAIFVPRPEVVTAARKSASRLSKQKPSITIAFSFRRKP